MSSSQIISLQALQQLKRAERESEATIQGILKMDKLQLLEEMIRYQEERSEKGALTLPLIVKGKHLFQAIADTSETREMQMLARSYHRHLEYELQEFLRTGRVTEEAEEAV